MGSRGMPSPMINDYTKNKFQESRTLFFADAKRPQQKTIASRPKTITEIKKLQSFVKSKQDASSGQDLTHSIKSMAKRDESFNEFLRNFRAKNEQNWSSIIDMT